MLKWMSEHTALVAMLLGFAFNLVTDIARAHRSESKAWRFVDEALSKAFPDPGGFARFVMALLSPPPPPVPPRKETLLPPSKYERPTTPTLECGTAWPRYWQLAGVTIAGVVLAACAGARVASYEAAQDACIVQAASMDVGSAAKNAEATACRCKVKEQYGRSCDGGAK